MKPKSVTLVTPLFDVVANRLPPAPIAAFVRTPADSLTDRKHSGLAFTRPGPRVTPPPTPSAFVATPRESSHRCSTRLTMATSQRNTDARIAVSSETRDLVRSQKRAGETYDELLRKMVEQYDPEEA